MARQYSIVCEDEVGAEVRRLAREYDLTEEAVLRQLIDRGLETVDEE